MALDIQAAVAAHRQAIEQVVQLAPTLEEVVAAMKETLATGGRIFACGNGGSAADAQHFAAELTGRYQKERLGYPAIALTTDTSALTAIGNDYGFEQIYARQLQSLARPGDLFVAISTSGNSANVVKAVEYAKSQRIRTVGLLGGNGGQLARLVDLPLVIGVPSTPRVQEAHILMLHLLCEAFEPTA
jgi:D-sedoheptulose 7-phosphate isomerase